MLPPPLRPRADILIVDDDAGVRDVCTTMLHALGYRAFVARGGEEAIEVAVTGGDRVDVALVDVHMPGVDGREVLRALKHLRPDVRVIVMSGAVREELGAYLEAGADAVLSKPFRFDELQATVAVALSTRDAAARAA